MKKLDSSQYSQDCINYIFSKTSLYNVCKVLSFVSSTTVT